MEINATITSRSGRVTCAVTRIDVAAGLPRKLVSLQREPAPLTIRRDWFGPGGVTIEIRDPGEANSHGLD